MLLENQDLVTYAICLSASVGLGIFSVFAATMTSAKLSRLPRFEDHPQTLTTYPFDCLMKG